MRDVQENKLKIKPYRTKLPKKLGVNMVKNHLKQKGILKNKSRMYNFFKGVTWDEEIYEGLKEVTVIHEKYISLKIM